MQRSKIDQWLQIHERIAPWNRKVFERYQLEKLNEMLAYCKQHSAFYRYLPQRINNLEEFAQIPLMTQGDVKTQSLLLVRPEEAVENAEAADGNIFFTTEDLARTVDFFSCGLSEAIDAGDRVLVCLPGGSADSPGELVAQAVRKLGAYAAVVGTDATYRRMLRAMQECEANVIVGMPVQLCSFARYVKAERAAWDIKASFVSADACTPKMEAMLKEELECEIYPHYGLRESGFGGAITCPAHSGMHIWESDLYIEIVDEAGNVLPAGSQGEIVLTTMRRRATPLVRYRTGDIGALDAEACPCGSIVRRLQNPRRRNILVLDIADADDAMFVHPQLLDYRITLSVEGCNFEAIIVKPLDEAALKKTLAALLPDDMLIKMIVRRYNAAEEKPFFANRRVVL